MMNKKNMCRLAACLLLTGMIGCLISACGSSKDTKTGSSGISSGDVKTELSEIDNTRWKYEKNDKVYYQLGISYCASPADKTLEKLAVIVPARYMNAKKNDNGTYTCTLNKKAKVGAYTAATAPIVMPVNTPGYSAQDAMTTYSSVKDYTDKGLVYVHAGCRGRDQGAPAGVTDLKAAIRYLRYNDGNIAGSMDRIFSFGMSGGGAQSVLLGVTGDSILYDKYLQKIGSVEGVSDAVAGSQAWCPITSLDSADEAYEWMMSTTRNGLSGSEKKISGKLTAAYADYINNLGLTDKDGNKLTLDKSDNGRYQAGSYYDYMKGIIEESLNNFLADTEFPYNAGSSSQEPVAGMSGAKGDTKSPDNAPSGAPSGNKPSGTPPSGAGSSGSDKMENAQANDHISRSGNSSGGVVLSGTYKSAKAYIRALNKNGTWVRYNSKKNTASITSIEAFAKAVKVSSKGIAAFDQLDASQGENTLFGYGDGKGRHFDSMLADILTGMDSKYAESFAGDLRKKDALGNSVAARLHMYSPMYYLMSSSGGYRSSVVAQNFRINSGIWQSDTAVNTEANLSLALKNYGSDVDYSFVWGQGHTMAERSGDSTSNFISWIGDCVKKK